jgi:pimeloyl-ACP methyl ester carboxylesterase
MSTAVLVHGSWSSPADWHWVAERLSGSGIASVVPDLPSHLSGSADRSDDVRAVESAVAASSSPVIVVGWSYGGAVISDLTDTGSIDRLLYVGHVPALSDGAALARFDPSEVPWLLTPDDSTVVLDNEWWLNTDQVRAWPDEVVRHLRDHRRRPISRSAWLAAPVAEAWRAVPTTVVVGRSDRFVPPEAQQVARERFDDVRLVEGDHFLPFLQPALLSNIIAELLGVD